MSNKRSALVGAIALAAIVAAAINFGVSALAQAVTSGPEFIPLSPFAFIPYTVFGVTAGAVGWAMIRRVVQHPAAVLRWLVPTVIVVSFIPDLVLYAGSHAGFVPILALMVMHVVVALVAVPVYARVLPVTKDAAVEPASTKPSVAA
jgi:hypothetical protein